MKIRLLGLAVLIALSAGFTLHAQEPKKQPKDETELEGKMDKMSGAWRKLKRQVADASKNAESLELVATARAAAEEAVKLTPAMAADIPAADRAKFIADYQEGVKKLVSALGQLEVALKADKNDEAVKLVADIGALQKSGHKQFKRPDEKK